MNNDKYIATAKIWLNAAERKYISAYYQRYGKDNPGIYEPLCFDCQQAAELAVKAVIIYFGCRGGLPRSHNIPFLLQQINGILKEEKNTEIPRSVEEAAQRLTVYATEGRYPDEDAVTADEYITPDEAASAVDFARRILDWAKVITV